MTNFIIRAQSQGDETILVEELTKVIKNSYVQYPFSWFTNLATFMVILSSLIIAFNIFQIYYISM